MIKQQKYQIVWVSLITRQRGRGSALLDQATASAKVRQMNHDFSDIRHWKEPIDQKD